MTPEQAQRLRQHVIVALDLETREAALELVEQLRPWVDKFKVGSRMFTQFGPALLDELHARGASIFLDLKFHDIPSVVGSACAAAAGHAGVFLLTVHASGGTRMIAQARSSVPSGVSVVAVTALTSLSTAELHSIGIPLSIESWAEKLAELAVEAGAHGVVCSAQELACLRRLLPAETIFVTPGIRAEPTTGDDQTRTLGAAEALALGSTYLVIGRPIYDAVDPVAALHEIGATL